MEGAMQTASNLMPHGMCYLWEPRLLGLHVVSDLLIGLAYFAIPPTLIYLVLRARREAGVDPTTGRRGVPHEFMVVAFGMFIVACGVTHLFGIYTVWVPAYWLSGSAKALTAGVSLATAAALPPLVPRAIELLRQARESEQRRIELEAALVELRDAKRRMRSTELLPVLEAAPVGMLAVRADGRIALSNAAAVEIFDADAGTLVGRQVEEFVPDHVARAHPDLRARFGEAPERRAMGTGRDLLALRADGTEVPVEIGLSPIETEEGPVVLASVSDITLRKKAEQELERSNASLEHFVYAASHDLKEPLRSVANFAELLAERYEGRLDERADRYIAFMVEEAHRINDLIGDMLAYSLSGQERRRDAELDLAELAREVVHEFAATLDELEGRVEIGDLPVVHADSVELSLILRNLVSNAIRYRRDEPPVVRIDARRVSSAWQIDVTDNGIGIPEEARERIFRIYQRLQPKGVEGGGTGLGLALCQRVVHAFGGEISVDSEPGRGSTFSFTIPDAPGHDAD